MEKRFFQALDEMSQHDAEHKTNYVGICDEQIYAQYAKRGGQITMGVPSEVFTRVIDGDVITILVVIDKKKYQALMSD